jgi:hypothetical protein
VGEALPFFLPLGGIFVFGGAAIAISSATAMVGGDFTWKRKALIVALLLLEAVSLGLMIRNSVERGRAVAAPSVAEDRCG